MDALVGYSGFVGSYLIRDGLDFYNSSNIDNIHGRSYRNIYCAGVYAEKWKANQDPTTDKASIVKLQSALASCICERFILISTIDVYDASVPQDESPDCCPNIYATHAYGRNRFDLEVWAQKTFPTTHIFRLPALFGHGLKKNALYDLLHSNQLANLRSHWVFQWYDLSWLVRDIDKHIAKDHRIVNLVTPAISLDLVCKLFFPSVLLSEERDKVAVYQITSVYGYSRSLEETLIAMSRFVRTSPSRLLVSELGWKPEDASIVRAFLRSRGVVSEEIVPSKRGWDMSNYSNAYSAQSILYGDTIQIFQEPERFLKILQERVVKLQSVGCKVIVFGSPKQRIYSGEDAVGLFRRIGDICQTAGIRFCLEHNASKYGGNWMTTLRDTVAFVREVDHPSVSVNLDTGSMILENENEIPPNALIGHVQVSFPNLGPWDSIPQVSAILSQLQSYAGYISFETTALTFSGVEAFLSECAPFQKSR